MLPFLLSHGPRSRTPKDLFDDNDVVIGNLLCEKNRLHKAYVDYPVDDNRAVFYRSRRLLQQRLREMQDAWTARKAEEIKGYADLNEWKNFFSTIKAVYVPPAKGTTPIPSAERNTQLTEMARILQRWPDTPEASSTVTASSPIPPSHVCLKWRKIWLRNNQSVLILDSFVPHLSSMHPP
nr:unnamed protein product [Spirometra erinaceieuropaei]